MIVVADTSVVLNLCRVRQDHLLPSLFGRVLIPVEVSSEFKRLVGVDSRFSGMELPGWIEIVSAPPAPREVVLANLDLGEAAAISLA